MERIFNFKCPSCAGRLQAQHAWIGLETTCPLCGNRIVIPDSSGAAPPPPQPVAPPPPPSKTPSLVDEDKAIEVEGGESFSDTKTARINLRRTDEKKKFLRNRILQLPTLPTIPANISLIIGYLRDENVDLKKVIDALKRDPVLVARILKLVNSGFYGIRSKVATIEHAINLLGFNQVRDVLLASSIMQMLTGKEKELWRHSYSTFKLMELLLSSIEGLTVSPNIQLAALMHDIGQVVLEDYDPVGYRFVRAEADKSKMLICPAEDNLFQMNHAEAGAWLLGHWQMADEIVIPVLYHHTSDTPSSHQPIDALPNYHVETAMLATADWIDCQVRGIPREPLPMGLLASCQLDQLDLVQWCQFHKQLVSSLDYQSPI